MSRQRLKRLQMEETATSWYVNAAVSMLLPIVPLLAIFGNGLVMIAVFRERSLQTVTNHLIVSLAVSDLLVAIFVMSFGIYFQVNHFTWGLGHVMCNIYLAADVMGSTASILNLFAISLDRYMAISHPLAYAQHGSRGGRATVSITIVWGVSIAVALPIFGIGEPQNDNTCEFSNAYFNIFSSLFSFFLPCGAMIVLYTIIFKRLRQRERARSQRKANRMENDRISSALLGGARIASQMGKHFKHRTDQILLEISFQTSSFPTLSESSEDRTSSSEPAVVKEARLNIPKHRPTTTTAIPLPSPAASLEIPPDPSPQINSTPVDDLSASKISQDFHRSFGEHLQEMFPFIDSGSRRSSVDDSDQSTEITSSNYLHKRSASYKKRKHQHADEEKIRPLVPHSTSSTPLRRTASQKQRRNGAAVYGRPLSDMPKEPVRNSISHPAHISDIPKVHRTVATTAPTSKENIAMRERIANSLLEQYRPQELDCSLGDSVKLYRKELWKRVTSGWKARPSRQLVKKATKQMRREHKATVTLAVVLAVFLVFWLPFFSLHFTNSFCVLVNGEGCIPGLLLTFTTWLGYINSSLNPLIYTVFDQRFRNAFKNIICCAKGRR